MTETASPVRLDVNARGVALLTLARPHIRNAFDETMIAAITQAVDDAARDPHARVLVLRGEGKSFSAGADLDWMRRAALFSPAENEADTRALGAMLTSLADCPKPTVAVAHGHALGGGVGLVSACDIALAANDAVFGLTEVRLGLIPAMISPFVIEAIGARAARRYFLTGERFDAATALRLGLVHQTAAPEALDGAVAAVVDALLACGPAAQASAKRLVRAVGGVERTAAMMDDLAERIATTRASDEGREGVAAFLEKRAPRWSA
jgi:methylglutaconyl-CoA hydratase